MGPPVGGEGGGPKSSNFRPHLSSEEPTHRAFSESSLVVARNLEKGNEELTATGQGRQGSVPCCLAAAFLRAESLGVVSGWGICGEKGQKQFRDK